MPGVAMSRAAARARRTVDRVARYLGEDVHRLREDAGMTRARLADAAALDRTFVGRIEDGATGSLETYVKLAMVLGADFAARLYPNTGPTIRDRHQATILEALLPRLGPNWARFPEVAVRRPARGWIDLVLHDRRSGTVVAVEIQSTLNRLEQLIRWSGEKAASLPSWDAFAQLGAVTAVSQLLVVRSTRSTRALGREYHGQLEASFPAHPGDAVDALAGTRAWPGAALVWVDVRAGAVRFLARR